MKLNDSAPGSSDSRRASRLGEDLARRKFDEVRALTPGQRLMIAFQLSDAAAALYHACSKKP
ncbi:MAG: hypothetical protein AABZ34_05420 [Nitrospirota bacterium]